MIKLGADQAHRYELDGWVDVIHLTWDSRCFLLGANLLLTLLSMPRYRANSKQHKGLAVKDVTDRALSSKSKHQDNDKLSGNSEGALLIRTKAFRNR